MIVKSKMLINGDTKNANRIWAGNTDASELKKHVELHADALLNLVTCWRVSLTSVSVFDGLSNRQFSRCLLVTVSAQDDNRVMSADDEESTGFKENVMKKRWKSQYNDRLDLSKTAGRNVARFCLTICRQLMCNVVHIRLRLRLRNSVLLIFNAFVQWEIPLHPSTLLVLMAPTRRKLNSSSLIPS